MSENTPTPAERAVAVALRIFPKNLNGCLVQIGGGTRAELTMYVVDQIREAVNDAIDKCEGLAWDYDTSESIAKAIRALKEKP